MLRKLFIFDIRLLEIGKMKKRNTLYFLLSLFMLLGFNSKVKAWGFWAHQRINRMAIFTLPPEMLLFYKTNIEYLTEHAVDPDMRRYAVEGEAPRHYMDVDHYGEYPFEMVPRKWKDAVDKFSEDTLMAYGIVPWHIQRHYYWLVDALKSEDAVKILKASADIGHYIADSNVPLHTTENYNGQMTGQKGIHGLWESRLPELFGMDYDYYIGSAGYFEDVLDEAWTWVLESHSALDSVLRYEIDASEKVGSDRKYSFENRNNVLVKTYSKQFCQIYNQMLSGMIERRMRTSILRVGSIWYSAWIDAGQPDLRKLVDKDYEPEQKIEYERKFKIIDRESGDVGAVTDPYEMIFGSCCGHGMDCQKKLPAISDLPLTKECETSAQVENQIHSHK